ncbi:hypothetical protein [Amycolatopsis sp. CA-230715]|uniref:hypothetical protein n=1 Tax=Amycolatopsis sp. CA-230715 TaxID=2745196 RepID=UPI001C013DDC|nr:hypothetical protein [Amycolatopsis sp. CA-230715]QWF78238.1 hypothetical protein HUW46_01633 [Amycolatopsis sp. CA-230715]
MGELEDLQQRILTQHRIQCQAEAGLLRDLAKMAEEHTRDEVVALLMDEFQMERQRARDTFDLAVAVTTSMSATLTAMDENGIGLDRAMEIYKVVRHFSREAEARAKETELLHQPFRVSG